jgi:transposase-like protein
MKFFDFCALISSNECLVAYMQSKNVIASNFNCNRCNLHMNLQKHVNSIDGVCFRCTKCKSRRSVRAGTFMEKSKLSLKVFAAILYFHHTEILQKHIAELLDISLVTLVDYSNFIREQCSKLLNSVDDQLGGPGIRVQVLY